MRACVVDALGRTTSNLDHQTGVRMRMTFQSSKTDANHTAEYANIEIGCLRSCKGIKARAVVKQLQKDATFSARKD